MCVLETLELLSENEIIVDSGPHQFAVAEYLFIKKSCQ